MPGIVAVLCCVIGFIALTAVIGLLGAGRQISKIAGDIVVEPLRKRIRSVLSRG